jgi:hypothetical protein
VPLCGCAAKTSGWMVCYNREKIELTNCIAPRKCGGRSSQHQVIANASTPKQSLSSIHHRMSLTCDHEFRENDSSFRSPRWDWCSRLSSTDIEPDNLQCTSNASKTGIHVRTRTIQWSAAADQQVSNVRLKALCLHEVFVQRGKLHAVAVYRCHSLSYITKRVPGINAGAAALLHARVDAGAAALLHSHINARNCWDRHISDPVSASETACAFHSEEIGVLVVSLRCLTQRRHPTASTALPRVCMVLPKKRCFVGNAKHHFRGCFSLGTAIPYIGMCYITRRRSSCSVSILQL